MNRREVYSRIEPGTLLHVALCSRGWLNQPFGRQNISDTLQPLQLAAIHAEPNQSFSAHRHIPKDCPACHVTQECWIIVRGSVMIGYYDLDGTLLESHWLGAGDCTITYRGGHSYMAGEDGVQAYEIKSGPYTNQAADKVFI